MRRLHPAGRDEKLVAQGQIELAAGRSEEFTEHIGPAGRRIVRVEESPSGQLWHLQLASDGRPERMEARLYREGPAHPADPTDPASPADPAPPANPAGSIRTDTKEQTIDLALTFYEDEVLVWRRGAAPASEQVIMPPGYRLLWPLQAGRAACMAGLEIAPGTTDTAMFCHLAPRPLARGGLRVRPVKFMIERESAGLRLTTPGLDPVHIEINPSVETPIPEPPSDRAAEGSALTESDQEETHPTRSEEEDSNSRPKEESK